MRKNALKKVSFFIIIDKIINIVFFKYSLFKKVTSAILRTLYFDLIQQQILLAKKLKNAYE